MDFGLSSDQVLLQDTLSRMLDENTPLDRVRAFAASDDDRAEEVWSAAVEVGLAGLLVDEEYGGAGLAFVDAALAAECLGRMVAPLPFTAACAVAPLALRDGGSAEQRTYWLPRIAGGVSVCGLAVSEHTGARENCAVRKEGARLHGRAMFTIDHQADIFLVADGEGMLHLVDAQAQHLERRALITVDRTRRVGELILKGVEAEPLPGSADGQLLLRSIDRARVLLAADTLGAAQHMLDAAVEYAKQREQFGRVIASFQAVKHMCAEMAAALEPCRAMIWYSAHALDALPEEAHLSACHVKAHVAEVGTFVARTATEVHGGMGFTDLLGLHYWFKRIGLNRQLLGSPERAREDAARAQGFIAA